MDDLNNVENEENENDLDRPLKIEDEVNLRASRVSFYSQISQELSIENLPEYSTDYDQSIKIILLGDSGTGKSSIVNCLQQDMTVLRKTISIEHFNYILKMNNFILRMQIWDTVGQEKFDSITTNYYKTTDVVIFVYAINDIDSFNNIIHWDNQLNDNENQNNSEEMNNNKHMIKVLVANKNDLEKERKISYEQGKQLCEDKNFDFFEEITCNFYKSSFLDENSYDSNKDNKNEIKDEKEQNNNFNNNNYNENDNNCVKKLFDKIGRIIYKQYKIDNDNRNNSSTYNYEANSTILTITEEKEKVDKSCCC